ncbi:MAG: polysaccharide deacetylase family protein [Bradymonadia bacterium]
MKRAELLSPRGVLALLGLCGVLYGALWWHQSPMAKAEQGATRGSQATEGAHHIDGAPQFSMKPPAWLNAPFEVPAMPRKILSLYGSHEWVEEEDEGRTWRTEVGPGNNPLHIHGELILNHLGLTVEHRDINDVKGLPDEAAMSAYRGVVVWLRDDRSADPEGLLRWYQAQALAGRPIVFMASTGALADLDDRPVDPVLMVQTFEALGIRFGVRESWAVEDIAVDPVKTPWLGFEAPVPLVAPYWREVEAIDEETEVWLRLHHTEYQASADAVFVGDKASFVMQGYAIQESKVGDRWVRQWIIDPFAFFERAFDLVGAPRLDFTTLNGSRLFYAHIDGDGMGTISELDRRSRCGQIVRDRLLEAYPLPTTVSVVVGRVQPRPEGRGSAADVALARSIFALPQVEVASHGLSHPMDWRAGHKAVLSVPDLPGYTLSAEGEIERSRQYIDDHLAPPGKPTRVMLWTGWCNPDADQIAVADRLGLYHLNGGDGRMDRLYPSYAHLAPPIHRVGDRFQFFTSAANDFILTDDWQPPYYRFGNIVDTFERSGAPRRILPVNLYYHFYIAQKSSAMAGIERAYDWIMTQPLAPVFVSEYLDIVKDFYYGQIARIGPSKWAVRTDGALRTVRFDGPPIHVDLEASPGVIGWLYVPEVDASYVHLSGPEAVIQLRETAGPPMLYVARASHHIDGITRTRKGLVLRMRGVGHKTLVLGGAHRERQYVLSYNAPSGKLESLVVVSDDIGRLTFEVPQDGAISVHVSLR